MKVLIWATSFGSDLWSLTRYLDQRPDVTVKVVMNDPDTYYREPVSKLFPLQAELIRRGRIQDLLGVPFFRPDVTIMDNRVPARATSPKGLMLWHGFGWKGPNDEEEFAFLHGALKRAWGDAKKPNPNFRWQCFGPWDMQHRSKISGFHPSNCRQLGAVSHDDLRVPLDKGRLQPFYPFDIVRRKTVLIAPTWHYGEVFAHWGSDADLFERLIAHLERREVNVILRLHDSFRFDRGYVKFLNDLAHRHPNVLLKFKDKAPDNFLDMQVSDLLLTNFSSIANLYYATLRPTIHVYPVKSADEEFQWRTLSFVGVRKKTIDSVRYIWKLPPETNGGLLSRSFDEVLMHVDQSIDEPRCCEAKARAFLDEHMLGADGRNGERVWNTLLELVEGRAPQPGII